MAIAIHKPKLSVSRRQLLTRLAMGTSAFTFIGCGDTARAQLPPANCNAPTDDIENDVNALEAEVFMEWGAVAAYTGALEILSPEARPFAEIFRGHHQQHVELAIAELKALGREIPERAALGSPPELTNDLEVLRYALTLEQQACNAYLGLIERLGASNLRYNAGNVLGCEFAHVIAIRAVLAGLDVGLVGEAADLAFITDNNPK